MKVRSIYALIIMILVLSMGIVGTASAHEGREVGDYLLEFGWQSEPAYAGLLNGPELFIEVHDAAEGTPFPEDVVVSLDVEVTFGSESITLPLEVVYGETGHYSADLLPTLPGDYTFRIIGTIGDTPIDEQFTSSDGEFSTVEPLEDIAFPSAGMSDITTLLAQIEALEARLTALEGQ